MPLHSLLMGKFGFGAEIGISTNKLHARGPIGAQRLVFIPIPCQWNVR